MISQPYVDGITDTVPHDIASTPAQGVAPADHGTFRYADPYSARCPDCGNPTGAAAEARKLLGSWAE
jgi:hypothetical protein